MDTLPVTPGTSVFIPTLFILIGIALCIGCQFVIIGLYRRREPVYLVFGLMSLAVAAYGASQIAVYEAATVADMALALRGRVAFACVCFPLFFVLISLYTNWRGGRPWFGIVSVLFAVFLVVNLLSPYSLRLSELREIRPVSLPWGETLNTYSGLPGKLDLFYRGSHILIFIWAIWRAGVLSRTGQKKRARVLAAYLALQFSALLYEALLVEVMGLAWIGVSEFAYLALVLIMSFHLGGELHSRSVASERSVIELQKEVGERKEAERALRDSEDKVRSIVETAPDFIYTMDRQGKILFINRTLPAFTREQVIGTGGFDYIPPQFHEHLRNALEHAFQTGEISEFEATGPGPEGATSWYLNRVGPIVHNRQVVGVTVCASDITARKQAEEALRQSEEQLRQAQKMEAVGRLAGGVAHDFNNLLTAIIGYGDLLLRSNRFGDPFRGYIEEIEKAAERAASLTRQLLAFSRKQMLQPRILDLNAVVTILSNMLHRLIGEHIELATVLGKELGRVSADPGQVDQVIMNLTVNSRDAMPEGGKLTIETANVELDEAFALEHVGVGPGHYVMLAVSDTGCGMDAETKSRIFEPFFTTKEQGKGTGLGLSTVYGIIRQSGGRILVESEPGRGATFTIYLPRVDSVVEAPPKTPVALESVRGRETILLVEDEDAVRELARCVLENNGYTVLAASSGGEALAIYERQSGTPHLLLTDMVMPQMSGRELVRALTTRQPEIRVLYISGYVGDALVRQGEMEQGTNLLPKPFTPETLVTKVREVLDANVKQRVE